MTNDRKPPMTEEEIETVASRVFEKLQAQSHFPTFEVPDQIAAKIENFVASGGKA